MEVYLLVSIAFIIVYYIATRYSKEQQSVAELHEQAISYSAKKLFLISILGLFTEMVLIRWVGTEVRVFAYVQNLALITCFVGFGLGCFRAHKPISLLRSLESIGFIVLLIAIPFPFWTLLIKNLSQSLTASADTALWGVAEASYPLLLWGAAVLIISLLLWKIMDTMMAIGSWVGHYLDLHRLS